MKEMNTDSLQFMVTKEMQESLQKNIKGMSVGLSTGKEMTPVEKTMKTLEEHFTFNDFSGERVETFLENDESLTNDLPHLVIAASLMFSDGSQMTDGGLRAYEMGNKIIVEEKSEGEWKTVRTIGTKVAQILAHARAEKRTEELEEIEEGLAGDGEDERNPALADFHTPYDERTTPSGNHGDGGVDDTTSAGPLTTGDTWSGIGEHTYEFDAKLPDMTEEQMEKLKDKALEIRKK